MSKLALGLALAGSGASAQAATIIIFTDPMTMERRTVVYQTPGPDRALLCMAPPAVSGCTEVPIRRGR